MSFKKAKTSNDKNLLVITLVFMGLMSIHPNKFRPYIYMATPFFAVCLAVVLHAAFSGSRSSARLLAWGRRIFWSGCLIVFFAGNILFSFKQIASPRVQPYLPFIKNIEAYIPRGTVVAGPRYFWPAMRKDHIFISSDQIVYEVDEIAKERGIKFDTLPEAEQDRILSDVLKIHNVGAVLLTCHNWNELASFRVTSTQIGETVRRYLFNTAEKKSDFLRTLYYPEARESDNYRDELYFPPDGFYNVGAEFQNSLKVYVLRP